MPNPFASIWEDAPPAPAPVAKPLIPRKPKPDHSEAKAIYAQYLAKTAVLKLHQEYALRVCHATAGAGMTPVKPLATMGTNGGALLCDHCKRPIILEGGAYNKIPVDEAWKLNTHRERKWISWISGGMVVKIVDNGTLRIYHGYEGNPKHCCSIARIEMDAAEAAHVRDTSVLRKLFLWAESEFPNPNEIVSAIFSTLYSFDPGIGVNVP